MRPTAILTAALLLTPACAWAQSGLSDTTCLIKPRMVVQLGAAVPGLLAKELVDRGDVVKQGQLVAQLESSMEEAQLALDQLKASNDTAIQAETVDMNKNQRVLDRKKDLVSKDVYKPDYLDEFTTNVAEGKLKILQAQMDQKVAGLSAQRSQVQLAQKQIRSSVDGVVVERKLSPGEYVYEQTPIMTIAQIDPLSVELIVPAARYGSIKLGEAAKILPNAPVGGSYDAVVDVVDPVIDAASNTFGVRLKLPNPGRTIPAGIRCSVDWGDNGPAVR
jgi:membrane fusion protein (multidrug efflux system)